MPDAAISTNRSDLFRQNARVRERLIDLAGHLDVIARRIRTLGLVRAAEDLAKVASELRRLGAGEAQRSA
jgi:hypothetical protein